MLISNLAPGGDLFIWIVCILLGFVGALVAIDAMPHKKKEDPGE